MSTILSQEECLVCDRVGVGTYYRELRQFGFKREDALKMLKCLAALYFKDPTLMAGKSRATIKCAVTYVAAVYLGYDRTQTEVIWFFNERQPGQGSVEYKQWHDEQIRLGAHIGCSFRPLFKVIMEKYRPTVEQATGYRKP